MCSIIKTSHSNLHPKSSLEQLKCANVYTEIIHPKNFSKL